VAHLSKSLFILRLDCAESGSTILEIKTNTESQERGLLLQTDLAGSLGPDRRCKPNNAPLRVYAGAA
jgi:hypothetical protein